VPNGPVDRTLSLSHRWLSPQGLAISIGSSPTYRTAAISLAALLVAGALYGVLFVLTDDDGGSALTSNGGEISDDPEEAPVIAIGDGVDGEAISAIVRQSVIDAGYNLRTLPAADADSPILTVLATNPGEGATVLNGGLWIPVTNFFHDANDVSLSVLQRLAAAEPVAWTELGSTVEGHVRLVVSGDTAALARVLGLSAIAPSVEVIAPESVPATVNADKSTLALAPLLAVDHRVRSLTVNGIGPTLKVGDVSQYPLHYRLYVDVPDAVGEAADLQRLLLDQLETALPSDPINPIRLLATGDIIFGRCTWTRTVQYGEPYIAAFLDVADFLKSADLTMGNMDNTLSDGITPMGCGTGTVNFVAPTSFLDGVEYAGIDIMTQGSNHLRDFGPQYVVETIDALDRYGITHAGAGRNLAEAQSAAIYEVAGVRFGIVSGVNIDVADNSSYWATPDSAGSAPIDTASVAASIAAVRDQVDYVIFAPQWGIEYIPGPSEKQAALAEAALAAGADLIVGNHPHVPQWALHNDPRGFVAWALGNFVYDQDWCYWTERSAILEAVFGDGRLLSIRYHPVKIEDYHRPHLTEGSDRENILRLIELGSTGQLANELICATSPLRTVLQPFVE
jgi:poly-gamma-glutamate synthesis protein (capsule biosynthesis protein)